MTRDEQIASLIWEANDIMNECSNGFDNETTDLIESIEYVDDLIQSAMILSESIDVVLYNESVLNEGQAWENVKKAGKATGKAISSVFKAIWDKIKAAWKWIKSRFTKKENKVAQKDGEVVDITAARQELDKIRTAAQGGRKYKLNKSGIFKQVKKGETVGDLEKLENNVNAVEKSITYGLQTQKLTEEEANALSRAAMEITNAINRSSIVCLPPANPNSPSLYMNEKHDSVKSNGNKLIIKDGSDKANGGIYDSRTQVRNGRHNVYLDRSDNLQFGEVWDAKRKIPRLSYSAEGRRSNGKLVNQYKANPVIGQKYNRGNKPINLPDDMERANKEHEEHMSEVYAKRAAERDRRRAKKEKARAAGKGPRKGRRKVLNDAIEVLTDQLLLCETVEDIQVITEAINALYEDDYEYDYYE